MTPAHLGSREVVATFHSKEVEERSKFFDEHDPLGVELLRAEKAMALHGGVVKDPTVEDPVEPKKDLLLWELKSPSQGGPEPQNPGVAESTAAPGLREQAKKYREMSLFEALLGGSKAMLFRHPDKDGH